MKIHINWKTSVAAVVAVLSVLTAFGLHVTPDQKAAIVSLIAAIMTFLGFEQSQGEQP